MSDEQLKGLPVNLYTWNESTGQWDKSQVDTLLTNILAKLEEIRLLLESP